MTTGLIPSPKMQFFDANGNPLVAGKLYSYAAGTSTPLATYTDSTGGSANANPVILDSRGEASVWLTSADYKLELYTSAGALIWTADYVNGANQPTLAALAASGGSDLIGYYAPDSAETMTVQDRLQLLDGESIVCGNADGYEKASINCYRDTTSVTGGTGGLVNPCIIAQTDAGASQTSFEWTILGIMENYNNSSAENVAGYFQGNKRGTGSTWGAVAEAKDYTGVANPTGGLVGFEVNCFANGTDTNSRRIGIDLVIGKADTSGTLPTVYAGIRIVPQSFTYTNGQFKHGILMDANFETALRVKNNSGTWGMLMDGTMSVGLDLSTATCSADFIRIKADAGAGPAHTGIDFYGDGSRKMFYSSHATGLGLFYAASGTTLLSVLDTGIVNIFGNLKINNTQILQDRITGYAAMTGTANKATVYDTSTITLVQLATRVKSIQDSLTTHGLIGA